MPRPVGRTRAHPWGAVLGSEVAAVFAHVAHVLEVPDGATSDHIRDVVKDYEGPERHALSPRRCLDGDHSTPYAVWVDTWTPTNCMSIVSPLVCPDGQS